MLALNFSGCTACSLCETAVHVGIGSRGAEKPTVLIVGQNPGYQEDAQGRAFIGPSGEELAGYVQAAGLASLVRVTNAVKCHTAGNAVPSNVSIKACRPHLIAEVQAYAPTYVIALGNIALKALTGKSGITKYAGSLEALHPDFDFDAVVVPTYHPAAALRTPALAQKIQLDFQRVGALVRNDNAAHTVPWHWCREPLECIDFVRLLAFDYETTGLSYARYGSEVIICSVDDSSESVHVVPANCKDYVQFSCRLASVFTHRVGFNSVRFDDGFLAREYGVSYLPEHSDDCMLAMALVDEEGAYNLEAGAVRYLGVPPWKDMITWDFSQLDLNETDQATLDKLAAYGARDTRYTRQLWSKLRARMQEENVERVYEHILKPVTAVFEKISKRGIYVSQENIRKEWRTLHDTAKHLNERLLFCAVPGFNYRSRKQLAEQIFEIYKCKSQGATATGAASLDKISLLKMQHALEPEDEAHRFITDLLAIRKAEKQISTYFKPWMKLAEADRESRVYPDYRTIGVVTGRTSSMKPNVQNLPRAKNVRSMIAAPPGFVRMETDESQLEMRLAAELSGCPTLTRAFVEGIDVHTLTASRITKKPIEDVTPRERTDAKPFNFSLLYGAEAWTVQQILLKDYGQVVELRAVERMRNAFFELYHLDSWYEEVANRLKRDKLVRSRTGRIRHLPNIDARDLDVRTEAIRMAVNFEDQSFGSDIVLIALVLTDKAIRLQNLGDHILITDYIHDSIGAQVREGYEGHFARITQQAMTSGVKAYLEKHFEIELKIPLLAETKVGPNWGDMRAYKL